MFCKHEWEPLGSETLQSPYEQLKENGESIWSPEGMKWLFIKTHIFYAKCKKCGKMYKSVTESR